MGAGGSGAEIPGGVAQPKPSVGGVAQFDHAVRAKEELRSIEAREHESEAIYDLLPKCSRKGASHERLQQTAV